MTRWFAAASVFGFLLFGAGLLTGCAAPGGASRMSELVIPGAVPDHVLAAATPILKREFGRTRVNREGRQIQTEPREYVTTRDSGTARDFYRGRSVMRRQALFSVTRRGDQTVARIRIDIERQDTERQQVMHPRGQRLSDNPGQETPIYADAATTEQQNTVWTPVRRDRKLERALLDELREQFAAERAIGRPGDSQSGAPEPTD
jgi:hypothetical protein